MLVCCLVHTKLASAFSKLQPTIWLIGFTQFPEELQGAQVFISKPGNVVFTRTQTVRMSASEKVLEGRFGKVYKLTLITLYRVDSVSFKVKLNIVLQIT